MPVHNNFSAHILTWQLPEQEKGQQRKDKSLHHMRSHEFDIQVSHDETTVTCYIEAKTGWYFAATWWCHDDDRASAQEYTAKFVRDGEAVHHAVFNHRKSANFQGIASAWIPDQDETPPPVDDDDERTQEDDTKEPYYFIFRNEDENSTVVPGNIGTLEIVIREVTQQDWHELARRRVEESDDEDSEDISSEEDDSDLDSTYDPGYKSVQYDKKSRAPETTDGVCLGETTTAHKNDLDPDDTFIDWRNRKPRQTHTAAMTTLDGRLWDDQRQYYRIPSLDNRVPNKTEGKLIVRFVFIYTTPEYINEHLQLEKRTDVLHPSQPSSSSPSPRRQPRGPLSEEPETERQSKRRRVDEIVKTEEEQALYARIERRRKEMATLQRQLDDLERARGKAAQGDKENPIKVED
ncbi:hypothetical protein Hypma_008205 [Hypsizygus marmoreus]|uniref:Uncharacterized protein n=1 Tax=Hypsizygus marmoreus TaxID=39966 RepID=A0A369JVU1_HYPMA|nr:hypothetical protein Hypma_008205 [Hypsizygus marmoreus]